MVQNTFSLLLTIYKIIGGDDDDDDNGAPAYSPESSPVETYLPIVLSPVSFPPVLAPTSGMFPPESDAQYNCDTP